MLTILIADDEKLERNGIKFLLKREKEEFQILEAVNGKDALGVLASHHIDLLLTDVKMPYMNGLELSAHVKENYPEVEIVIFSGYNDFTYAREALRYGVVDYVLKPVDPEEFHKTMSRVTEHIRERMADRERQDRQEKAERGYHVDHGSEAGDHSGGGLHIFLIMHGGHCQAEQPLGNGGAQLV